MEGYHQACRSEEDRLSLHIIVTSIMPYFELSYKLRELSKLNSLISFNSSYKFELRTLSLRHITATAPLRSLCSYVSTYPPGYASKSSRCRLPRIAKAICGCELSAGHQTKSHYLEIMPAMQRLQDVWLLPRRKCMCSEQIWQKL